MSQTYKTDRPDGGADRGAIQESIMHMIERLRGARIPGKYNLWYDQTSGITDFRKSIDDPRGVPDNSVYVGTVKIESSYAFNGASEFSGLEDAVDYVLCRGSIS